MSSSLSVDSLASNYEEINGDFIPLSKRERLSVIHIIGICASMLAYQIAYSVEFALGTPIMARLNVSQTLQSFIWLTGPLSGFIVQPLIGFYSDTFRARLGRRRPFIIVGGVGIVSGFIVLSLVEKIGGLLSKTNSNGYSIGVLAFALLLTNVSINVLQGPSRALLGDVIPKSQQVLANSLGSFMLGIAAVVANLIGGLELAQYTNGKFTTEQLVIYFGCVLLVLGVICTLLCAREEQFVGRVERENPLKEIFKTAKEMPAPVFRISMVYLMSWMAYFPFNVEVTDYFGRDIYKAEPKTPMYDKGVSFGMLVIAVSNVLVMIYGAFQESVLKCLGMKISYAISQIIEGFCLLSVFYTKDKHLLLGLLAPLGISCTIFNSVPFAVVGMIVEQSKMGTYMGILNSFAVVGQQISSFILVSGVGSVVKNKAPIIGGGAVFAFISAIMCSWIIVPKEDKDKFEHLLSTKE